MKGYITRKKNQRYVVIYEGLDPATGKERRRWHPAGTDRTEAEALARRLAEQECERRGAGRSRLTLAGHVERTWLPRKTRQLQPTTFDGYRRQLRLYILPALGHIALRSLRVEEIEDLYDHLLTAGKQDDTGGGCPPSPSSRSTSCCARSSTTPSPADCFRRTRHGRPCPHVTGVTSIAAGWPGPPANSAPS